MRPLESGSIVTLYSCGVETVDIVIPVLAPTAIWLSLEPRECFFLGELWSFGNHSTYKTSEFVVREPEEIPLIISFQIRIFLDLPNLIN